jgi:hypothetical protein
LLPYITPNDYLLSFELEGYAVETPTEQMYKTMIEWVDEKTKKYNISLDVKHLPTHHEIRASKSCPGLVERERMIREILIKRSPGVVIAPVEDKTTQLNAIQQRILAIQEMLSNLLKMRK